MSPGRNPPVTLSMPSIKKLLSPDVILPETEIVPLVAVLVDACCGSATKKGFKRPLFSSKKLYTGSNWSRVIGLYVIDTFHL